MKALRITLFSLLLVPASLLGSDFSEFEIPTHTWHTASSQLSAGAGRQKNAERNFSTSSGLVDASTAWGFDSDRLSTTLSASFAADASSQRVRDNRSYHFLSQLVTEQGDVRVKRAFEGWNIAGELRIYPWRSAASLIIRGSGVGNYSQEWSSRHFRSEFADTNVFVFRVDRGQEEWRYFYGTAYGASIGFGRVRDATAVYRAYLLERRLLASGALAGPLSRAAREKIAALYYVENRYSIVHDRPEKFFWRDLERILVDDGNLGEAGLDPYSLLRALEPYLPGSELPLMRRVGFFVGPTVEGMHARWIQRLHGDDRTASFTNDTLVSGFYTAGSERVGISQDEVRIGAEAEFHYPAGMRVQIDAASRLLIPTRDLHHSLNLVSDASLAYLIADRWEWNVLVRHSRGISKLPNGTRNSNWLVDYVAVLSFYLEDRVKLDLRAEELQGEQDFFWRGYGRSRRINLGISYHFLGGLDAPGLIEPQRLIPPAPRLY